MKRILLLLVFMLTVKASPYAYSEEPDNTKRYDYWPDGRKRSCGVYDLRDRLLGRVIFRYDGSVERLQKYDESGNKVEESIYDAGGNLTPGIDGWAATRWRYAGRALAYQTTYDIFGTSIERKIYDERGDLVARQLHAEDDEDYGNASKLSGLAGKQAVIFYNADGNVQSSVLIDK